MWKHGFLGYDSSLMLDVVVTALVLVVPVMVFSIWQVKHGQYASHKRLQLGLAVVLLLAVTAFEVDMQWVHGGWENVVNKDTENPRLTGDAFSLAQTVLYVHLVFAVSTPLLWVTTIVLALKRMPSPPAPCAHSPLHRKLGWASTIDLVLTSVTGLAFYYVAFMR
jgi:putative membrane protein